MTSELHLTSVPGDIYYHEGATGNTLAWTAVALYPVELTYSITLDGAPIVDEAAWESGVPITCTVDGLPVGSHVYVITFANSLSSTSLVTSTARVIVQENPDTTPPSIVLEDTPAYWPDDVDMNIRATFTDAGGSGIVAARLYYTQTTPFYADFVPFVDGVAYLPTAMLPARSTIFYCLYAEDGAGNAVILDAAGLHPCDPSNPLASVITLFDMFEDPWPNSGVAYVSTPRFARSPPVVGVQNSIRFRFTLAAVGVSGREVTNFGFSIYYDNGYRVPIALTKVEILSYTEALCYGTFIPDRIGQWGAQMNAEYMNMHIYGETFAYEAVAGNPVPPPAIESVRGIFAPVQAGIPQVIEFAVAFPEGYDLTAFKLDAPCELVRVHYDKVTLNQPLLDWGDIPAVPVGTGEDRVVIFRTEVPTAGYCAGSLTAAAYYLEFRSLERVYAGAGGYSNLEADARAAPFTFAVTKDHQMMVVEEVQTGLVDFRSPLILTCLFTEGTWTSVTSVGAYYRTDRLDWDDSRYVEFLDGVATLPTGSLMLGLLQYYVVVTGGNGELFYCMAGSNGVQEVYSSSYDSDLKTKARTYAFTHRIGFLDIESPEIGYPSCPGFVLRPESGQVITCPVMDFGGSGLAWARIYYRARGQSWDPARWAPILGDQALISASAYGSPDIVEYYVAASDWQGNAIYRGAAGLGDVPEDVQGMPFYFTIGGKDPIVVRFVVEGGTLYNFVLPGALAAYIIRLQNKGTLAGTYTIEVLGLVAGSYVLSESSVTLMPWDDAVTVTCVVDSSGLAAGPHPFEIRVDVYGEEYQFPAIVAVDDYPVISSPPDMGYEVNEVVPNQFISWNVHGIYWDGDASWEVSAIPVGGSPVVIETGLARYNYNVHVHVSGLVEGIWRYVLKVGDGYGLFSSDEVLVTVRPDDDNIAPSINEIITAPFTVAELLIRRPPRSSAPVPDSAEWVGIFVNATDAQSGIYSVFVEAGGRLMQAIFWADLGFYYVLLPNPRTLGTYVVHAVATDKDNESPGDSMSSDAYDSFTVVNTPPRVLSFFADATTAGDFPATYTFTDQDLVPYTNSWQVGVQAEVGVTEDYIHVIPEHAGHADVLQFNKNASARLLLGGPWLNFPVPSGTVEFWAAIEGDADFMTVMGPATKGASGPWIACVQGQLFFVAGSNILTPLGAISPGWHHFQVRFACEGHALDELGEN